MGMIDDEKQCDECNRHWIERKQEHLDSVEMFLRQVEKERNESTDYYEATKIVINRWRDSV